LYEVIKTSYDPAVPKKSRFPILREAWPRIVDYRETKLRSFMVDGRRNRNGRREYFTDLIQAKTRADQLAVQRENQGTASLSFTPRDRVMAEECRELLRPFGKTPLEAVQHYVAHLEADRIRSKSPLIRDCVAQFMALKERDQQRGDLATRSLVVFRQTTNQLVAVLGDLTIKQFDVDRVTTYLDSFPVGPRTRNNTRLRLSALFNFCKTKKWIELNPCAEIKIKVRRSDVTILTVDETEGLLRAAQQSKHSGVLVPYLSLCLFGGMRPHEAQQLDWARVHFNTASIHVLASTSKRREGRYFHMEPALIEWLKSYAMPKGPIVGANFRRKWESLIDDVGYSVDRPWPQDVMRHTAASMLLAIKRNRALVAEELGTSVDVLRRHYRQPILKSEAQRFWMLKPGR
jgi:integrase